MNEKLKKIAIKMIHFIQFMKPFYILINLMIELNF